jgi:hypothetical protein
MQSPSALRTQHIVDGGTKINPLLKHYYEVGYFVCVFSSALFGLEVLQMLPFQLKQVRDNCVRCRPAG